MQYDYYICDVFTSTPFGGNQLAVLPNASGLSDGQMQQIAREFNFSESTFVLPPELGHTKKVRIFTPKREVPFAGHPNVGTAFVLASIGALGTFKNTKSITFEEKAGLVDIDITKLENDRLYCEIKAPEDLTTGLQIPMDLVARALSIQPNEIVVKHHVPQQVSVGLPFVMTELKNLDALQRVKINLDGFHQIQNDYNIWPSIHMYIKSNDDYDIRARMFAPVSGVPEDPATGSANLALSAFLASLRPELSGEFQYKIAQGVEMGRPSVLKSRVEKQNGKIISTKIGGESVITCKGTLYID